MILRSDGIVSSVSVAVLAIWLVAGAAPACADQLTLKNGDRLSGKVVGVEGTSLVFKPSAFGQVKVPLDTVEALTTDEPVTVEFKEGGYATGRLSPSETGAVRLTGPNETVSAFDLATIKAMHPGRTVPQFKWTGHVNLGVSNSNGNTDTAAYHFDTQTVGRGAKDRITLGARYNREESEGDTTADNAAVSGQFDRFITDAWYLYVAGSAERDELADLNLRTTGGGGAGYQIIDTPRTQLSFSAGPTYVHEDFETAPDEEFLGGRWATDFSMWVFDDFAQIFHNHEGIVSLEDASDVLLRTRTGARIPIRDSLNVAAQVNWDYDNVPAPGNEKSDIKYILSIGYLW